MGKLIDLTGQRFGRLVVLERARAARHGESAKWLCHCDCGKEKIVSGKLLRRGDTRSCGCLHSEELREMSITHGLSKTRLYCVWSSMKDRCYRPACKSYPNYGGRGITVCPEWLHDFAAFRDWAMSHGYDESVPCGTCTLDRIDNDKGYSPENCRFVSMKVQNNNRRPRRKK